MFKYKNHHLTGRTREYFEGWYLKHQTKSCCISFIPGIHIDTHGNKKAFIQIITPELSKIIYYDYRHFYADEHQFDIRIGTNHFTESGLQINIQTEDFQCVGVLHYHHKTPLRYDIMGPFSVMSQMECNHGIISLHHTLSGRLTINQTTVDFYNGTGYIEKDWGSSFPASYTWLQAHPRICSPHQKKCSLFVSIARIPFGPLHFTGHIAVLYINQKEYRFATYNGSHIMKHSTRKIILNKRNYHLVLSFKPGSSNAHPLSAPASGDMCRTIHEQMTIPLTIRLYKNKKLIFSAKTTAASYECSSQ